VGFSSSCGHGIPQDLLDHVFAACARCHAQPLAVTMALRANAHPVGDMPVHGEVSTSARVETATRPTLVDAFFVQRDLPPEHPDVRVQMRSRCLHP
jgi:hypothetical protein